MELIHKNQNLFKFVLFGKKGNYINLFELDTRGCPTGIPSQYTILRFKSIYL